MADPQQQQTKWAVQRKYPRFALDQRLVAKSGSTLLHGRTKDLSEGGMGATIAGDLPMGTILDLEFLLPGARETLRLSSEVRYRQGFQYGFRFLHPTESQLEAIRLAIRQLQPSV